ncbi:MAG: PHB depolymerase family esterase [Pseudomonadota bacterium]
MIMRRRLVTGIWTGLMALHVLAAPAVHAAAAVDAAEAAKAVDYPLLEKIAAPAGTAQSDADLGILKGLKRDGFAAARFQPKQGAAMPYRLLQPLSPQAGVRYPLVVVLHGSGAVGDDNVSQLNWLGLSWSIPEVQRRFPAYVLIPQFPERSTNYADGTDGLPASQAGAPLEIALQLLDDVAARHPVDTKRIYLTGFSMGASTAWNAVQLRPGKFAAAVPFSGIPPDRNSAVQFRDIPLLIVHGNADTENPIQPDQAMVAALQKLGSKNLHFREYEGMEHRVPADMLLDMRWREWLFAQKNKD